MEKEPIKKSYELRFASLAPEIWKRLGEIHRTGWVNRGIEDSETVQDHTVALVVLASSISDFLVGFSQVDKQKLLDMLEIHDWPEVIDGDKVILTKDSVERNRLKEAKFISERDAMLKITEVLGVEGKKIFDLWLQFETSEDKVADLARQIDKYQAIEKAFEYEKVLKKPLFREFLDYDRERITNPLLVQKLEDLVKSCDDLIQKVS
jgi:putative hydrolase of HD superfamily